MKWYVGSDHAGWKLKRVLCTMLKDLGDELVDVGTDSETSVDYPKYGSEVARRVVADPSSLGLVIDGTGIGIGIAANKIRGVRCAIVSDTFSAEIARAHNDANMIALGARVLGPGLAESIVKSFRSTQFIGGRHQRRVDQLAELDR